MSKPFDKDLYDKDDKAKDFVIQFFNERFHYKAYVNPDPYGIDVIIEKGDMVYELEVEVKRSWHGKSFPYKTLHYAYRKIKFANNPEHVHFITLNSDWTYGILVTGEVIASSPVIVKDTIYTKKEKFVEVSIENCVRMRLF